MNAQWWVAIVASVLTPCSAPVLARADDGTLPRLLKTPFDEPTAKRAQQDWARYLKREVIESNSIEMQLMLIPPGEFLMGSPPGEVGRSKNEQLHPVRITRPFFLGVYPVTQAGYEAVMGRNPSSFSRTGYDKQQVASLDTARFPVERVSWNDAQSFCERLSKRDGHTYRLPTEAEWEYACRAGTTTPFNFGNSLNGREANCDGYYPYGSDVKGQYLKRPTVVGSYRANAFGLYDMHGNIWQLCKDWFGQDYDAKSQSADPAGPASGQYRVIRGGGWSGSPVLCRSAARLDVDPARPGSSVGFRVVREP